MAISVLQRISASIFNFAGIQEFGGVFRVVSQVFIRRFHFSGFSLFSTCSWPISTKAGRTCFGSASLSAQQERGIFCSEEKLFATLKINTLMRTYRFKIECARDSVSSIVHRHGKMVWERQPAS